MTPQQIEKFETIRADIFAYTMHLVSANGASSEARWLVATALSEAVALQVVKHAIETNGDMRGGIEAHTKILNDACAKLYDALGRGRRADEPIQ